MEEPSGHSISRRQVVFYAAGKWSGADSSKSGQQVGAVQAQPGHIYQVARMETSLVTRWATWIVIVVGRF